MAENGRDEHEDTAETKVVSEQGDPQPPPADAADSTRSGDGDAQYHSAEGGRSPALPAGPHHIQRSPGGNGERRSSAGERTDICRDFLKNICNRGSRCKYYHPTEVQHDQQQEDVKFCIDYQNRGCGRENCRYVHAHREDADRYKRSGEVTLSLARAIAAVTSKDSVNGIPFCKEFQTGTCSRGNNRCRYWHINPAEERERRRMEQFHRSDYRGRSGSEHDYQPPPPPPMPYGRGDPYQPPPRPGYDYEASFADPLPLKRPRYEPEHRAPSPRYVHDLERKNGDLMKENEQLKRELTRERERYEDLYALFRQQSQGQASQAPASFAAPVVVQQPPIMSNTALVASAAAAPIYTATVPYAPGAPHATELVSLAQAVSLASQSAAIHQSRPPMSNPSDVAVHWSVAPSHWST
uniref:C3H1-type domain-containing protein n=1 Tax=Plectus sambesii TaxID=2011161 RepID=A0A914W6J4_9BILA